MGERFVDYLPRDREDELRRITKVLVAPGKGILAADERLVSAAGLLFRFTQLR